MPKRATSTTFKKGQGGRKTGSKNKDTLAKEAALDTYQQAMLNLLMPLVRAQQMAAQGLVVVLRPSLVKNLKTNKLERSGELKQVKDPDEIEHLFNSKGVGQDYHIVFAKDPNIKAISDIFDRVFGKPKEQVDINLGWRRQKLQDIQDKMNFVIDLVSKEAKKKGIQ